MIIFDKTMPNGAIARYHVAKKFEILKDATHAVVNSYHNEQLDLISWQDTYVIPSVIKIETLDDVEYVLAYTNGPFDGGTIVPDETATLDSKKARLSALVKILRDKAEWGGVTTPLGVIDSDPESQRKILGVVTTASIIGPDFTIDWRMKDNSVAVQIDQTTMVQIGMLVSQHVAACQTHKNTIDAQIAACTTEEELQAIDIEQGWPANAPDPVAA